MMKDSQPVIVILTPDQARRLTDEVRADAASLWTKLLRLYEGGAHSALGYSSWGAYFEAEFNQTPRRGYQLLEAARVAHVLSHTEPSDGSEQLFTESQARELTPLLDEPELLREAWDTAVQRTAGRPTAGVIREIVRQHDAGLADAQAELNDVGAAIGQQFKTEDPGKWTGVIYRLFRALEGISDLPEPAAVAAHIEQFEAYRVNGLADAIRWLHAFETIWSERNDR